jgi:hypothetical protein
MGMYEDAKETFLENYDENPKKTRDRFLGMMKPVVVKAGEEKKKEYKEMRKIDVEENPEKFKEKFLEWCEKHLGV